MLDLVDGMECQGALGEAHRGTCVRFGSLAAQATVPADWCALKISDNSFADSNNRYLPLDWPIENYLGLHLCPK